MRTASSRLPQVQQAFLRGNRCVVICSSRYPVAKKNQGRTHRLQYTSKYMNRVEHNYIVFENESLATVFPLNKISHYVLSPKSFTLFTNHKALCSAFEKENYMIVWLDVLTSSPTKLKHILLQWYFKSTRCLPILAKSRMEQWILTFCINNWYRENDLWKRIISNIRFPNVSGNALRSKRAGSDWTDCAKLFLLGRSNVLANRRWSASNCTQLFMPSYITYISQWYWTLWSWSNQTFSLGEVLVANVPQGYLWIC